MGTPLARSDSRSWRNPRNGAIPVPAPAMIIGTCGFAGGRKGMLGCRTKTKTVPRSGTVVRLRVHTPRNDEQSPERAGPSTTPTVSATSVLIVGDDEIE